MFRSADKKRKITVDSRSKGESRSQDFAVDCRTLFFFILYIFCAFIRNARNTLPQNIEKNEFIRTVNVLTQNKNNLHFFLCIGELKLARVTVSPMLVNTGPFRLVVSATEFGHLGGARYIKQL